MKLKLPCLLAAGVCAVVSGLSPTRASIVNFETNPSLPTAPSIYVAVPAMQTLTTPEATFSGGVVLGFATFFPAISFATAPNVYGTANFANALPEALTIDVNPATTTTEVSFALFNGEVFNQTYSVDAFNGSTLVANQTLTNMAPNFNAGYGLVDVTAPGGITKVVITPVGSPSAWDFLIDTIGFNQSISTVVVPPVVQPSVPPVQGHRHGHGQGETELLEVDFGDDVNDIRGSVLVVPAPEPGSSLLMLAGLGAMALVRRRRPA